MYVMYCAPLSWKMVKMCVQKRKWPRSTYCMPVNILDCVRAAIQGKGANHIIKKMMVQFDKVKAIAAFWCQKCLGWLRWRIRFLKSECKIQKNLAQQDVVKFWAK